MGLTETPAEQRLRTVRDACALTRAERDALDLGREALALLGRYEAMGSYGEFAGWRADMCALLARARSVA